jgi:hypothetical protein
MDEDEVNVEILDVWIPAFPSRAMKTYEEIQKYVEEKEKICQ